MRSDWRVQVYSKNGWGTVSRHDNKHRAMQAAKEYHRSHISVSHHNIRVVPA